MIIKLETFAWGHSGMQPSDNAPTLWVRAREAEDRIEILEKQVAAMERVSRRVLEARLKEPTR